MMSYKTKEVPIHLPMEEYLMEDLGIATRCDVHKFALKHLYKTRKQSKLELIWVQRPLSQRCQHLFIDVRVSEKEIQDDHWPTHHWVDWRVVWVQEEVMNRNHQSKSEAAQSFCSSTTERRQQPDSCWWQVHGSPWPLRVDGLAGGCDEPAQTWIRSPERSLDEGWDWSWGQTVWTPPPPSSTSPPGWGCH